MTASLLRLTWDGALHVREQVFIDVLESVNILMSQNGTLLRSDVTGKIKMKALLTGMPECKFGLNDKLLMDRDAAAGGGGKRRSQSVELEDCAFHRCVRLRTFDTDRTITFVPPDGEFELMRYGPGATRCCQHTLHTNQRPRSVLLAPLPQLPHHGEHQPAVPHHPRY